MVTFVYCRFRRSNCRSGPEKKDIFSTVSGISCFPFLNGGVSGPACLDVRVFVKRERMEKTNLWSRVKRMEELMRIWPSALTCAGLTSEIAYASCAVIIVFNNFSLSLSRSLAVNSKVV